MALKEVPTQKTSPISVRSFSTVLKCRSTSCRLVGNKRFGGILKYGTIFGVFGNLVEGELKGSERNRDKCNIGKIRGFHSISLKFWLVPIRRGHGKTFPLRAGNSHLGHVLGGGRESIIRPPLSPLQVRDIFCAL